MNRPDFYLKVNRNSSGILDSSQKFDSLNDFTLSPYTFNSFFLVIFRNWSSKSKLNFIKAINEEKTKKFKLIIDKPKYVKDLDLLQIINQMIQRIGEEENDTFFMNKIDFLEYAYDKYIKFIFDMIEMFENSSDGNKNGIKRITNYLFSKKGHIIHFYLILLDSIKLQKDRLGNILIINSRVQKEIITDKENNIKLVNIFNKIEKDLKLIINKTLYNYVDIFLF